METKCVIRGIAGCLLAVMLTGCAALSGASALSSIVSPGVSALVPKGGIDAQIGDRTLKGQENKSKVQAKVEKIKAKEAKVDQSSQKKDQKTEIASVAGDVKVQQGPSGFTLGFLGLGWPLFVIYLVYSLWRKRNA